MKKKTMIILTICCGLAIVPALFPFIKNAISNLSGSSMSSTERIAKMIQDTHPTDLMIYGDDVLFEMQVPARKLEAITEDSLNIKDGCECAFLVINDLSGSVQLSDADIKLLDNQLRTKPLSLFYLGDQYGDAWQEPGEYTMEIPGNRSYQYNMEYGQMCRGIGAWRGQEEEISKQNPYLLGDVILYRIESFLSFLETNDEYPSQS